jgi:hypothetical protein
VATRTQNEQEGDDDHEEEDNDEDDEDDGDDEDDENGDDEDGAVGAASTEDASGEVVPVAQGIDGTPAVSRICETMDWMLPFHDDVPSCPSIPLRITPQTHCCGSSC